MGTYLRNYNSKNRHNTSNYIRIYIIIINASVFTMLHTLRTAWPWTNTEMTKYKKQACRCRWNLRDNRGKMCWNSGQHNQLTVKLVTNAQHTDKRCSRNGNNPVGVPLWSGYRNGLNSQLRMAKESFGCGHRCQPSANDGSS
jgi:hypothetical protein